MGQPNRSCSVVTENRLAAERRLTLMLVTQIELEPGFRLMLVPEGRGNNLAPQVAAWLRGDWIEPMPVLRAISPPDPSCS